MKELSIEEKAKAYDEAIKRAKAMIPVAANQEEIYNSVITIFPELKESEDERIRKEIIEYIKTGTYHKSWIAWLEKLGQIKSPISQHENKMCLISKDERIKAQLIEFFSGYNTDEEWWGNITEKDILAWLEKQGESIDIPTDAVLDSNKDGLIADTIRYKREKQGEQKPVDKVEPKFKVGDIIRHKEQRCTCKITAVDTTTAEYGVSECSGTHLPFDFQDAWELVEQKPAEWSEKDREYMQSLLDIINGTSSLTPSEVKCHKDWLKSLKDRVQPKFTWKPSDRQMNVLEYYMHTLACNEHKEILFGLYQDLKKLKE